MYEYTRHAKTRTQQRCIGDAVIAAVSAMGYELHDKGGCTFVSCSKNNQKALATGLRKLADKLEHKDSVFFVEADNGNLVTAGHKYRRHRRR